MPVTTSLPLRDPLPGPGLFEFCIDSISIHIKGLTSAGPDHKTQLCGLQWAYTTHDSCPRTYSFLETMTPSAFGCMRLRQLDSSVPPPRCEMTHEGPMQGLVPRTVVLFNNNNNNTAVPNLLSPNADRDKDVTSRHGFTAMVSQLSRAVSWGRGVSCDQDAQQSDIALRPQVGLHTRADPCSSIADTRTFARFGINLDCYVLQMIVFQCWPTSRGP